MSLVGQQKNQELPLEVSPRTILLVDDDPDTRALTRTFLEHLGYRVFSSGDAERAAQIFRNVPQIDLLITDLYMPGRSGLELAQELCGSCSDLPVLMISGGFVAQEHREKFQQAGWSFLAKPFLLPDLLARVNLILQTDIPESELDTMPFPTL